MDYNERVKCSLREEAVNEQGEPKVLPVTSFLQLRRLRLNATERSIDRRRKRGYGEEPRFLSVGIKSGRDRGRDAD
jgi:hypothetical protein